MVRTERELISSGFAGFPRGASAVLMGSAVASLQSSGAVLVCVAPVRVAGLSGIRAGKLPGSGALQSLAAKDSAGGAVSRPGGRGRPSPCGAFAPVSV